MHCFFTKIICDGVLKLIKGKNQFYIKLICSQCVSVISKNNSNDSEINSISTHKFIKKFHIKWFMTLL